MLHQALQYIKFLKASTNQHGVHSPFVFDLVTRCLYDKTHYKAYATLAKYRQELLEIDRKIHITDFGSGSRVFKSNERVISQMVKTSGTPLKRMKLLFRLVNYVKPTKTLELGTLFGLATSAMALGYGENNITSVEGCSATLNVAKTQIENFGFKKIHLINARFEAILPELSQYTYDLIIFDGNHQKKATLDYFTLLLPTAHNDSLFIFDDIYLSDGMTQAWETIKQHPKVTVTVDLFYLGLVFFRKEQVKQHFKIRV